MDPGMVRNLARLCRLELSDEEVVRAAEQIARQRTWRCSVAEAIAVGHELDTALAGHAEHVGGGHTTPSCSQVIICIQMRKPIGI